MIQLLRYQDDREREPFTQWLDSLRDKMAQARVRVRLRQLEAGNFGDCQSVGGGVLELRIHVGAGYRAYFGRHRQTVVLLLCGGDKQTQKKDIKHAQLLWALWKAEQS